MITDTTENFSLKDKVWLNPEKACKVLSYVVDIRFILRFYFSMNPIAKGYVMDFMKKNKTFAKLGYEDLTQTKFPQYIKKVNAKDFEQRHSTINFEDYCKRRSTSEVSFKFIFRALNVIYHKARNTSVLKIAFLMWTEQNILSNENVSSFRAKTKTTNNR